MGSIENKNRDKWQDKSGIQGKAAEINIFELFTELFKNTENTHYRIRKPKEFENHYLNIELSEQTINEIYNPEEGVIKKHGFAPDFAIDNIKTNKTIYIESKKQDGWVEGGKRADGRGNAHERSCKYFTPGILKALRKKGNIHNPDYLPFWTIFQGNLTRDPCRVREITCWYEGFEGNMFFWRNANKKDELINHFNTYIKKILD